MMIAVKALLIGLFGGIAAGIFGIGGGIVIIPGLIFLLGFDQLKAQGTTLALMVPPISILAAYKYYQEGHVDIAVALYVCLAFVLGGWVGAKLALPIPEIILRRSFAVLLMLVAVKLFFSKPVF